MRLPPLLMNAAHTAKAGRCLAGEAHERRCRSYTERLVSRSGTHCPTPRATLPSSDQVRSTLLSTPRSCQTDHLYLIMTPPGHVGVWGWTPDHITRAIGDQAPWFGRVPNSPC